MSLLFLTLHGLFHGKSKLSIIESTDSTNLHGLTSFIQVVLITLVTFTHKWENRLFLLSYICWWAKSIIHTCWTWCIHTNCILSSFLLTDLLHLINANLKPPILLVFFYRKYILHPTFSSEHSISILILNHRICQQISKYP